MAWTNLPTNYTDAVWSGNRKYTQVDNSDGTVSFVDKTEYTNKENSFFGAAEANAMNAAINTLMTLAGITVVTSPDDGHFIPLYDGTEINAITLATLMEKLNAPVLEKIAPLLYTGAGAHNAIYRGKNLGTSVTDAQWAAISAGTFEDLYIGDYWVINGVNWRIAAFDYYYRTGDTDCTTHHVVIVPDSNLYTAQMNTSNVTTGAYVGSAMYTSNLANAKTAINNAFGSGHILSHRQYLQNATTNGYASAGSWYDSTVELMTEQNVYGCKVFGNCINGTNLPDSHTVDKSQYPLFRHRPDLISNRSWFWLRDVASAAFFCGVGGRGDAFCGDASSSCGVRPAFSIKS